MTVVRGAAMLLCLAAAACDRPTSHDREPATDDRSAAAAAVANESAADDQLLTSTRVDALQNQVDQLQAELADKTGGNAQLETEALEARVEALEQRVYADKPAAAFPPVDPVAPVAPKPVATPAARPHAAASPPTRPRRRLDLDLSDHP